MSHPFRPGALAALLAAGLFAAPQPAAAQGFFESLFGFGAKPATPAARVPAPVITDYRARPYIPERATSNRGASPSDDDAQPSQSGRYRTLCVRMCDGFYWPVSAAATRSNLHRDADICRSSCGSDARLFFHDKASGDATTMVDLTGRAYSRLPVAFLYRKTLVSGCACKPEPWTQSELDRHRQYAADVAAPANRPATRADESLATAEPAPSRAPPAPSPALDVAGPSDIPTGRSEPATEPAPAAPAPAAPLARRIATAHSPSSRSHAPSRIAIHTSAPTKPRPALVRAARNPVPQGIFGLGAKPSRWPGD